MIIKNKKINNNNYYYVILIFAVIKFFSPDECPQSDDQPILSFYVTTLNKNPSHPHKKASFWVELPFSSSNPNAFWKFLFIFSLISVTLNN